MVRRMIEYLDSKQVGERVGLAHQTVRQMRARGQMPDPDAMIGRAVGWLPATIDRWQASRKTGGELHGSPLTRGCA